MKAGRWVVTVRHRESTSIKPISFEYFDTENEANGRAAQMRSHIKCKGKHYRVYVAHVIEAQTI